MNILFIDNFDSFTFNLVEEFEKRKCNVLVYRNNTEEKIIERVITEFKPNLIVLSPGPSVPKNAGICIDLVKKYYKEIPIFGVCLGHQCIVEALGGKIAQCTEIVHGKSSPIYHNNDKIFKGIENPFHGGRYHSLIVEYCPDGMEVIARSNDLVMAIRHKKYRLLGIQFHPESILTPSGGELIENVLEEVK